MADLLQLAVGAAVLWAPGVAWTAALAPGLDPPKFLAASVVLALTLQPALLYALSVFLGVALTPANAVLASLMLAGLGSARALRPWLTRALTEPPRRAGRR